MAANPKFIDQHKLLASTSSPLSFTPVKNSRLYNAMCKGSTGAGNINVTVLGNGVGDAISLDPFSVNWSYNLITTGTEAANDGNSVYYETFKYGIYPVLQPIDLKFNGTFPLTLNTELQYQLEGTGIQDSSIITVNFSTGDTLKQCTDALMTSLINNVNSNLGLANDETSKSLAPIQYTYNGNVNQINLSAVYSKSSEFNNTLILGALNDFTATAITNGYRYSYESLTIDSLNLENSVLQVIPSVTPVRFSYDSGLSSNVSGLSLLPNPARSTFLNSGAYWNENAGNAGSQIDPYPLHPDLKLKIQNLLNSGTVEGQNISRDSTDNIITQDFASAPVLASDAFTTASEDIDAFKDANVPFKIIDAHGNKFIPVSKGQKITITAPEASSILLVYAEE